MDLTWILSAKDNASTVFDKVKQSGTGAADGVQSAFSGVLSKFNLLTGAVGAMAGIAAGGVFAKIISETVAWTGEAVALGKALGVSTEKASVLNLALGDVYLTKEQMLAGSQRIAKTLSTEEDAFKRLGVATRDQTGHYRSTLDIMTDVNTKLLTIKEGTDRNIAGMTIYGKSWGELSGLLKLNSAAMQEAEEKAKRLGLLVGDEGVAQAKKYKAALNDIEDVGKSLAVRFGTVLLPSLVKVGAYLGNNGPVLSDAFRISLQFLGNTVFTLGDWLGLLAFRAYSLGAVLKSVLAGNFSDAKREWQAMVAAGDDFSARTKKAWTDWSDKPITSKAVKGDVLDVNFGKEDEIARAAEAALKKPLELWKDSARQILTVEKERIAALITAEKEYLDKIRKTFDDRVSMLDKFRASYTAVLDSIAARDKTLADERDAQLYANEDSYSRYYRQRMELVTAEQRADADPGFSGDSIAKKMKSYDDQIGKAKQLRDEVLAGKVQIISKEQAERDFLETKQKLEEKIKLIGDDQIKQQTLGAEKAAEAIGIMERGLKVQQDQLAIIDQMLKNIPAVTEKELRIKVTGLQDLYSIGTLTNDYGSAATNASVMADLPQYASGTPYVPRTGPAIIHRGERIITAEDNARGNYGGNVSFGDFNLVLPNVTNQSTAKDLVREAIPEIKKQLARFL